MSGDPSPIRIMAVDDHPLLRQRIVGLVADQSDMKMVAEASNGREAIPQFRTHRPVVLQDEIHRIARESLRKASRQARAGHIETEITYGESLRLRFRDD